MPTFIPPTRQEGSSDYFFGRYSIPVGQSVVKVNGVYTTQPYPWLGDLVNLTEGVDYFLGGHEYPVDNEMALILEAAGFPVNDFAMRGWFTALANRNNAEAKVLVVGDSISEGAVAGSYTARWQYLLQNQIRSRYPTNGGAGGPGYIPSVTVTGAPAAPVTTSGSPATNFADHGLGVKQLKVNNTQYVEWAQTCDSFRIYYAKDASFAGGAIISVDGVDQTPQISSSGTKADGFVWESGPLTPGSHTIRVRGNAAFGAIIEACEFFNADKGRGVRIYDGAHWGASVANFITTAADTGHWQVVNYLQPALVVVNLGTNDIGAGVATFKANLTTFITKLRTQAPNCIIALVKGYRPGTASDYTWQTFRDAVDQVAVATTNCQTFDLMAKWPRFTADGQNTQGLMYEAVNPIHPNAAGHQKYADIMTDFLAPLSPPAGFTVGAPGYGEGLYGAGAYG